MQAYATKTLPRTDEWAEPTPRPSCPPVAIASDVNAGLFDQVLSRIADLVADRLIERTAAKADAQSTEWMDARRAAEYLGIHRDTLRKLAAQRAIPAHQDGPRCKLYFQRDELDDWRRMTHRRLRAIS